jgi:transglutaminase-like putative cysteine protease
VGAAEPTDITIDHQVWWHPASSSLQMDGWPDEGEQYTVTSVRPDVDTDVLRTATTALVSPAETLLPDNIPPVIAETAARWTAGAETPFEKTMAIVDHLRNGDFTYTLNVDYGDSSDALVKFLDAKRGFCQQFASLTAVMLRTLNIPARVALGFIEGNPTGPGTWSVSAKQYHAWVEVPFKGYGWLSFEPTPRFNDPSAIWQPADQTPTTCSGGPQCDENAHPQPTSSASARPRVKGGGQQDITADPTGGAGNGGGVSIASRPVEVVAIAAALIAVLLALAIPTLRWLRRRRRLRSARTPRELVLAQYDVFADRALELGWAKSPGETPDEYRSRLLATDRLGADGEPLTRLTATVVGAAYGPDDPDGADVDGIEADASAVLQRLRTLTPWRQRVIGRYRRS